MKNIQRTPLTDDPGREAVRQVDVVVLAVYLLKGDTRSVDTEEVAVKAHEIAPGMFSWRKYPSQINLELVRVSLSDAKKHTHGALLAGSGREGWRLTTAGLEWVRGAGQELLAAGPPETPRARNAGSIDTVRKEREKRRLAASDAWRDWSAGRAVSLRAAEEVFRIDDYSKGKLLEVKLVRLRALFDDDERVSEFLKEAERVIRVQTGGTIDD